MQKKKYISGIVSVSVIWITLTLFSGWSRAAAETKKEEKPAEKVELYQLSNDDLLKQAQTIFSQAEDTFRGQMRGLAEVEKLLTEAQKTTKALVIPPKDPPTPYKDTDPVEAAKNAADYAKARLEVISRQLELVQAEKDLSDKHITQIESAKSAAASFIDAIAKLDIFLFEIGLRVRDGSLTSDKISVLFTEENLRRQKQQISVRQEQLKKKSEAAQDHLKTLVLNLEEAKKSVTEAKAYHASAEEKYTQEMKRQSLEKEYSGQSPERLITRLSNLQEERVWLDSAFNQTRSRFTAVQKKSPDIQKELDELPQPDTEDMLVLRPDAAIRTEEMEEAAKQVDAVADYHSEHIEKVGELRLALELLIKQGEVFQGDATVLRDHLSRMQVPAKLLKEFAGQGKIKADEIPGDCRIESLSASSDDISKTLSDVLSAVQKAREQIDQIAKDIEKSETIRREAKERSDQLKKFMKLPGKPGSGMRNSKI